MDLFSAPLDRVSFNDIESFLGLAQSEDQRLREGERIDYKEQIPQDLGDWVTAFANVTGGLIFVGIKSDKKKQNVPVAWNGISPAADVETQINAKILSTVRPKPEFNIGSVTLPTGNIILIVRVTEGTYPPYEYQQGNTTRITMRTHDALRSAGVRDIEALFKKRTENAPLSEQAILRYVNAVGFDCTHSNGVQDYDFHRAVIIPRRRTQLRLDSNLEREFELRILKHFPQEPGISASGRRGEYLQLESRVVSSFSWHHLWRVYDNGAIGFTGSLMGDFPHGKPIGDLALDLVSTSRLCSSSLRDTKSRERYMLLSFCARLLPHSCQDSLSFPGTTT